MASSKDPFSILNKDPQRGAVIPKYDPSVRVARYRPGTVPKWSVDDDIVDLSTKPIHPSSISIETSNVFIADLTGFEAEPDRKDIRKEHEVGNRHQEASSSDGEMYEEEEEEEDRPVTTLFKPVFVEKSQRVTEVDAANLQREEEETEAALQRLHQTRREETQRLISAALTQESQEAISDSELLSDTDDNGDPEQYKLWKVREVKRMIREREERSARQKELKEIERRRNLSDWERQEENKKLGTDETAKPVTNPMQFMQKWAHRGAFFQDRDESGKLDPIFMRDINAPVEGDFDKSTLPAALQKRRGIFGQKGQSKWTHLTAEDTTDFNPAFMPDQKLAVKQQLKQGGYKGMNQFSNSRQET